MSLLESRDPEVGVDLRGRVLIISFQRPERLNAFTESMILELARLLEVAESDEQVGALVLTGTGRAFCAGGDMQGGLSGEVDSEYLAQFRAVQRATTGRLYSFPKPVVAALPGVAAGAGVGLALACALRVGTPRTGLVSGFAGMELSGDFGATWLVDRMLGLGRAQSFLLLDRRLDATECLERGVLHDVVSQEDLLDTAVAHAAGWAGRSLLAYRGLLDNLATAGSEDLPDAMDAEAARQLACSFTEHHRRAAARFTSPAPKTTGDIP